jgi:hypothetical protein
MVRRPVFPPPSIRAFPEDEGSKGFAPERA